MSKTLIIVPSRGRPHNIDILWQAWKDTEATADILVATDNNDVEYPRIDGIMYETRPQMNMVEKLNYFAALNWHEYDYIGFFGDDNVPRTKHWDINLSKFGVNYGNDLFQGERLPTSCIISSNIIRGLGYFCPPELIHLFADDFWYLLGENTKRNYHVDIIIEHMHYLSSGKSQEDATYKLGNSPEVWAHDRAAWENWLDNKMETEMEKVKSLNVL